MQIGAQDFEELYDLFKCGDVMRYRTNDWQDVEGLEINAQSARKRTCISTFDSQQHTYSTGRRVLIIK